MSEPHHASDLRQLMEAFGTVPRPHGQLRSLPIQFRWEATRRHPYYQHFWKSASPPDDGRIETRTLEEAVGRIRTFILGQIGVSGQPIDPATPFEQLDADKLKEGWLSGAVHPISFRGLVGLLLVGLPQQTIERLGVLFTGAGREDKEGEPPHNVAALIELQGLNLQGLDSYADEPIVSVNPAASSRLVNEAMSALMKHWKEERGIGDQRNRSDKYDRYLKVWDLREGWNDGAYDRMAEKSFREVARTVRTVIPTVNNQYRQAFELITGHPYSVALWVRLFGILKLSDLLGGQPGPIASRRPLRPATRRDVPDSIVSANADMGLSSMATDRGTGFDELVSDIMELIRTGRSDEQVVQELGLSTVDAVAYLRRREDDFGES